MTITKMMFDLIRVLVLVVKILLHAIIQDFEFSDHTRSHYITELMNTQKVLQDIEVEVHKYV